MGEPGQFYSPKSLSSMGKIALNMPYYVYNYKGGRNECFRYGVDKDTHWKDYDLTSAYTTGMAALTLP